MVETNTLNLTATILSGEALSDAIDLSAFATNKDSYRLFSITLPEMTSAAITFQSSRDNGVTWLDLYDATNTEITIPASTGIREIVLDPYIFSSVYMLKVRSGTSGTVVNQAAERLIGLITRNV